MYYVKRSDANLYLHLDGWHENPCPVTSVQDLIAVLQLQQREFPQFYLEITTNYC